MRRVLIAAIVVLYSMALLCAFMPELLGEWTTYYMYFIAAILLVHIAELGLFFKYVKKCPGSLGLSIFLTIIFGFLHWLPYKNKD